jgi:hypothetical protein
MDADFLTIAHEYGEVPMMSVPPRSLAPLASPSQNQMAME